MTITLPLFEAYLQCPMKCWLKSINESSRGNAYAEWVKTQTEFYLAEATKRLRSGELVPGCTVVPEIKNLKGDKRLLAVDVAGRTREFSSTEVRNRKKKTPTRCDTPNSASQINQGPMTSDSRVRIESRLHAVERIPGKGPSDPTQFLPIRLAFTNKLGKHNKLLLAFDALALSETLGRKISVGKIIHGDHHSTLRVKIGDLLSQVRKHIEKTAVLLASSSPPELVLNGHCSECEFQLGCRQKATEKDDLSLLSGMREKERKKLHNEGIFTVTQLSYRFRPRRRPKKFRDKREKCHHSLKALAVREKKIYVVGAPDLKVEGTPVYLDVEGLPDRDFYYLKELADPGRHEDRPPTWVPLVFHCTTFEHIEQILEEGRLKPDSRGAVSFTEIPIGELDRMKYRHRGAEQVAIGFPRRYIESLGLTPVWYLRHNPEIRKILADLKTRDTEGYKEISSFIDEEGDVSSFQEVRTKGFVDMAESVWLLTTKREGDPLRLVIPGVDKFQTKHGRISKSYWHRSHQLEILSEWQFTASTKNDEEVTEDFRIIGEYYWQQQVTEEKELNVIMPIEEKKKIRFEVMQSGKQSAYQGPWRFIDVACSIAKILLNAGENLDQILLYRLIKDMPIV